MSNNWYVLTGAPCSGKTSIIKCLQQQGFQVIPELARVYIDQQLAKGIPLEELRKDELGFQKKILQLKIDTEKSLDQDQIIFFDRGIPDSAAYYKLCGLENDPDLDLAVQQCQYKKVFLLDYLDYKKDYARTESREDQIKLHYYLEEAYQALPFPLIKVPIVPDKAEKAKRIEYILNEI